MALNILYPNGEVLAVEVFVWQGGQPVKWDGSVTASVTVGVVDQGAAGLDPWSVEFLAPQHVIVDSAPASTVTNDGTFATPVKQDTGNASLASIDGKITAVNTGAVVVSSSALPTGAATEATLLTRTKPADQQHVIIDSSSAIAVTVASLPLPAGAATEATLALILTQTQFNTLIGSLTETAPANDTASSGLNGRLQRIAQRLTTLITNLGSPFQAGGSIGNTTFGATQATAANLNMTEASATAILATLGATSGAKVITDANGTIQQYLRGLIYQLITPAVTFFTPTPDTANGWLVKMMTSADGSTALTNSAQEIKATAGKLGGWYIYNPNSSAAYVLIYNVAAASVTVGTTNPQMCLCIPATSAANVEFSMGIPFTNAGFSAAAATTGPGNTAPSTALEANFLYK